MNKRALRRQKTELTIQFLDPTEVPNVINLLREYIYYHKVDYEKSCITKDIYGKASIKPDDFRKIMNKFVYPFTPGELDEILQLSPKTYKGMIQYRAFFNGIRRLGRPRTLFSVKKLLGIRTDFYESFDTIVAENYFSLKNGYEFMKYDLRLLNIQLLADEDEDDANLENFNNRVLLDNFVINFSRDFLRAVKAGYPSREALTDDLIFRTFGIKDFEWDNFLQP